MRPEVQALSWWVRRLPDCGPAGTFWRDTVGLPLLGQKGDNWDDLGPYFLFSGGSFLELELLPGATERPFYDRKEQQHRVPVFRTYAFDATLAAWLAGGARLLERADEKAGRTAYVVEPGGSISALREPPPGSTDPVDVAAAVHAAAGATVLPGSKPMPAGVLDLGWVLLHVVDVPLELAFYRDVLGLDVLQDDGAAGAVLWLGDLGRLELRPGGTLEPVPEDRLDVAEMWMLRVADMEPVVADLRAAGTPFVHEPWRVAGGHLAYVADPEGRLVGVQSHTEDGRPTETLAARRWRERQP
ncbi:MAG TPA: VOC family protein [Mycobacteriales bacterium]|jgi:predicted enzyme related to lactoylglutathione lyase|nr:VOC family protein [Mycobacteriales bacterium]